MDRRTFIKNSCLACMGISAGMAMLEACTATRHISGVLTDNGLSVPLKAFVSGQNGQQVFHRYIIIRNEALQFPICVYRNSETSYTALYLRCSHQGAELQVGGERLSCPAHGSEFDASGQVRQGPADQPLRSFPVVVREQELFIDLRKVS